jgi:hypothetical protein
MIEPDSGPDDSVVPKLPAGWIAQWDSRYVQLSFECAFKSLGRRNTRLALQHSFVFSGISDIPPKSTPHPSLCVILPLLRPTLYSSRKYYYVQISTGKSTWDTPTEVAPGVVTGSASTTPAQHGTPYSPPPPVGMSGQPDKEGARGLGGPQHGESTDRAGGLGVSPRVCAVARAHR